MEKEKFECIKRKIKRIYKGYLGEREDVEANIFDVAKCFDIKLEEDRAKDYQIVEIDYKTPSIQIKDIKNNVLFVSEYTTDADLLSYGSSGYPSFIKVRQIYSNLSTIERLFLIGQEEFVAEQIIIPNGNYEMIFEKENPHNIGMYPNASVKQVIRYAIRTEKDGENVKQMLLNKILGYNYDEEKSKMEYMFNQKYTYGHPKHIEYGDEQDKYSYFYDDRVVYGVQELRTKDTSAFIRGICFENLKYRDIARHLPSHIDERNSPELWDLSYVSGITFIGRTDNSVWHGFKILKSKDFVGVKYIAKRKNRFENEKGLMEYSETIVARKDVKYPILEKDCLTSLELRNIISVLETEFEEDSFIRLVIKELQTFGNKMDIRKGSIEDEKDPLSPKLFIEKSGEEILAMILEDKEQYFSLIEDEFQKMTHIEENEEYQRLLSKKGEINENK